MFKEGRVVSAPELRLLSSETSVYHLGHRSEEYLSSVGDSAGFPEILGIEQFYLLHLRGPLNFAVDVQAFGC